MSVMGRFSFFILKVSTGILVYPHLCTLPIAKTVLKSTVHSYNVLNHHNVLKSHTSNASPETKQNSF